MSDKSEKKKPTPAMINFWLRCLCGTFALAIALGAISTVCAPPLRVLIERDSSGVVVRTSESSADMTTPFTVVFLVASGFLLYVINGYRITKFAAGGIEAEAAQQAAESADKYAKTESLEAAVPTSEPENASPEPTEAPSKVLTANGQSYSVFELADIPFSVIADAIVNWPNGVPRPNNLSDFEFALRKPGRGNIPWIIKFNGCEPIKVSYGGQGKKSSTVASQQS